MKLSRFVLTALLTVAVLASCGDDDEPAAARDDTATDSPDAGSSGISTDDAPGDDAAAATCATVAEESAQAQGDRSFPDNPGTTFTVNSSEVQEDGCVLVVVTATPDVGYSELAFLSACDGGAAVLHGAYFGDAGAWTLLFSTDEGDAAGAPAEVDAA